jgi:hypothetical protein
MGNQTIFPQVGLGTHARTELEPMAEYKITRNSDDKDDGKPGWMHREVRDHDRRYECDGHIFVDGPWGGLVCKKCGR